MTRVWYGSFGSGIIDTDELRMPVLFGLVLYNNLGSFDCGMVWHSMVHYGTLALLVVSLSDIIDTNELRMPKCFGIAWHGMVWHSMVWYGTLALVLVSLSDIIDTDELRMLVVCLLQCHG